MLTEQKEVEIKKAIAWFIRNNFVLEGKKQAIDEKVIYLSGEMYDLFSYLFLEKK